MGETAGSYVGVDAEDHHKINTVANDLGKFRESIISQQSDLEESNSKTSKVSNVSQIGQANNREKNKKKMQNYKDSMDYGTQGFHDDRWDGEGGEDEDNEEIDYEGSDYREYLAAIGETQKKDDSVAGGG